VRVISIIEARGTLNELEPKVSGKISRLRAGEVKASQRSNPRRRTIPFPKNLIENSNLMIWVTVCKAEQPFKVGLSSFQSYFQWEVKKRRLMIQGEVLTRARRTSQLSVTATSPTGTAVTVPL
jgi:hypothetical protein